ncbi:unnamed protein product [Caenorhabditis bovis]|uniref:SAM-dependent methyltransferase TRM5/TYW2-type domain-containing protein n=1 Tax=Caenorhabditis bovis TaxID=2654633 RepID=A0A8S1EB50_9PELO|nr:unnamed protein product [Caenorhabditis bovis]
MSNPHLNNSAHPVRRRFDSEHADTIQSEISMSVVTDDTRMFGNRRRSTFMGVNDSSGCCFSINAEPVLFLITSCFGIYSINTSLFTYWARCVEIAQGRSDLSTNATYSCALLSKLNSTLENDVQSDIADAKIYLQLASSIPTLIICPLIGTYSDRHGRKLPLIFSLFGILLATICHLLSTLTYTSINMYYFLFAGETIMGLFGGGPSVITTCLAIVTDDVRHKLKPGSSTVPMRVMISSIGQSVGMMFGTFIVSLISIPALSSIEKHSFGYVKCATIQVGISLIALIYTVFFVRETHFPKHEDFQYNVFNEDEEVDEQNEIALKHSRCRRLFQYVSAVLTVLTVRRPGWTRLCLCVSLILIFVEFLSNDPALLLLLVKRMPFSWNDSMFSYFSLIRSFISTAGMIFCPLLLTLCHWLGKDSLLIIAGLLASSFISFITAFATSTEHIFITAGLTLLTGAMQPAYRSFLPRMVAKEETARLLTCATILLSFSPIISSLVFNSIFEASMTWWPGFAFFVAGIFQATVFIGQTIVHILMRPQWKLDKQLRNRRLVENESQEEIDDHPPDSEQRSISNTAVDSDGVDNAMAAPRKSSDAILAKASNFGQMLEDVRKLAISKSLWDDEMQRDLPKKWEKHGDLIVFPQNSFTHKNWRYIGREVWPVVAKALNVARVGRKRQIDELRTPHVDLLYGSDGWVEHIDERGVRFLYDATKRVFDNYKKTEMKRIAKWACQGQTIIDLYASLGYFSLTFLVACEAKNVVSIDWNEDILESLIRSAQVNHVDDKLLVIHGDCRRVCPSQSADRIYLGLLPSCKAHWLVACKALKPEGGMIHINEIIDVNAKKEAEVKKEPRKLLRQATLPATMPAEEDELEKRLNAVAERLKKEKQESDENQIPSETEEKKEKKKFTRSATIVEEMENRVLPDVKIWKEFEQLGWAKISEKHKEFAMECAQSCTRFLNNIHLSDAMYCTTIVNVTRYGEVSKGKEHIVLDILCCQQTAPIEHLIAKFTAENLKPLN